MRPSEHFENAGALLGNRNLPVVFRTYKKKDGGALTVGYDFGDM
ncbi:MAG: hypothetical protein ACQEU4_07700 [Bacillota bacterium]